MKDETLFWCKKCHVNFGSALEPPLCPLCGSESNIPASLIRTPERDWSKDWSCAQHVLNSKDDDDDGTEDPSKK